MSPDFKVTQPEAASISKRWGQQEEGGLSLGGTEDLQTGLQALAKKIQAHVSVATFGSKRWQQPCSPAAVREKGASEGGPTSEPLPSPNVGLSPALISRGEQGHSWEGGQKLRA